MKKSLALVFLFSVFLAGCKMTDPQEHWEAQRCEHQRIFLQCMTSLPVGPLSTKYNDWDEVVGSCDTVAREQSLQIQRKNQPEVCPAADK